MNMYVHGFNRSQRKLIVRCVAWFERQNRVRVGVRMSREIGEVYGIRDSRKEPYLIHDAPTKVKMPSFKAETSEGEDPLAAEILLDLIEQALKEDPSLRVMPRIQQRVFLSA